MPILKTMNLTDVELSHERQKVLSSLYEKMKHDKEKLEEQVTILLTTNNELSAYASVFKLDENVEQANTVSALQDATVSDNDMLIMNEVSQLDYADIGNDIIDLDVGNV